MKNSIDISLYDENNQTIFGTLTIEGYPPPSGHHVNSSNATMLREIDPQGAMTYVVSVILIYGLAIVFMIASHVFVKKKEERWENQLRVVDKYFEQVHWIRESGARESYRKLKHSLVPVVAQSTARDLISRRLSFQPILAKAGLLMDNGAAKLRDKSSSHESVNSDPDEVFHHEKHMHVPSFLELPGRRSNQPSMPSISEEPSIEDATPVSDVTHISDDVTIEIPPTESFPIENHGINGKRTEDFPPFRVSGISNDYRVPHYLPTYTSTLHIPSRYALYNEQQINEFMAKMKETRIQSNVDLSNSAYQSNLCHSIENINEYPHDTDLDSSANSGMFYLPQKDDFAGVHDPSVYQLTWLPQQPGSDSSSHSHQDLSSLQDTRKDVNISKAQPEKSTQNQVKHTQPSSAGQYTRQNQFKPEMSSSMWIQPPAVQNSRKNHKEKASQHKAMPENDPNGSYEDSVHLLNTEL